MPDYGLRDGAYFAEQPVPSPSGLCESTESADATAERLWEATLRSASKLDVAYGRRDEQLYQMLAAIHRLHAELGPRWESYLRAKRVRLVPQARSQFQPIAKFLLGTTRYAETAKATAYAAVLDEAVEHGIDSDRIVNWLRYNGGVDKIYRGRVARLTPPASKSEHEQLVREWLSRPPIAVIELPDGHCEIDGRDGLFVAVIQVDGSKIAIRDLFPGFDQNWIFRQAEKRMREGEPSAPRSPTAPILQPIEPVVPEPVVLGHGPAAKVAIEKYPDNHPGLEDKIVKSPRRRHVRLLVGDCLERLATLEDDSINLIVTSPPYAEARKSTYGGIPANQYVDWWMTRAAEFKRVLARDGSLVVNIKEGSDQGEQSPYVLELILAMREAEWLWTEEYIWHKRNSVPGKWPNRFRNGWERCLHFTLDRKFAMYQDAVMVPIGAWAKPRLANLSDTDRIREPSASGSPFAIKVSNWDGRDHAYPTNVLHFATECCLVGHSAAFPEKLPEFFIKLFSRQGDLVCDPFVGSGTTGVVCKRLNRKFIGIDILEENIRLAKTRIGEARLGAVAD